LTPTLRPLAPNEIADILLEHPDVAEAAVVEEEGLDGTSYPMAYVVPHTARMQEAKSRVYLADRDRRIAQWRKAFDQVYRFGRDNNAPAFVGWTSTYTNKPIPETEMREWRDRTAERITALAPDRILEIGCGVGLLVEALAPRCSAYCGTDLSPVAVSRLRDFVATRPDLRHVELLEREATNFDDLTPGSVDMVVINSVAQYFPDADYLRKVLAGAARVVASGGHIFVGDVRHLGLLPVFHGAVQLAKAPPGASVRWLKRRVSLAIEQERELVLNPEFFLALSESVPDITDVEILLKRGPTDNELSRYRYDVLLHVGSEKPSVSPRVAEWQADNDTVAELVSRFEAEQLPSVRILKVPNSRVASDLAAVRLLWSADDRESVRDLRQRAAKEQVVTGTDPEDFWKLCDRPAHNLCVGWSPDALDGSFDVSLVDRRRSLDAPSLRRAANGSPGTDQPVFATDPLAAGFKQQLGLELAKGLSAKLPEALLPAAVVVVNQLPSNAPTTPPGLAAREAAWRDREQMIQG
jgi:SAM-dependent methyltransferase